MRVLLVEDHLPLAENIGEYLSARDMVVDYAYDGIMAFNLATTTIYDLFILDLTLPKLDGLKLGHRLREAGLRAPMLMLTARDTLDDKLAGFAVGADDYLTKPFELAELDVRLRALMRRAGGHTNILRCGDLVLDVSSQQAQRGGCVLKLTPTGLKILELLLRRSPALVSRAELSRCLWGDEPPEGEASLRVHIHGLRTAIDKPYTHALLKTLPGIGYRLSNDAAT